MEVRVGKETHRTQWILYPREPVAVFRCEPVDTPCVRMEGREYKPESWHVFCPHCGVLWATRVNVDLDNINWTCKRWPCQACNGGSLWDAWNEPWNRSLPYDLLKREMNLIKTWYDEGIRTYQQFFQYKHFRRKV